MLTVQKVCELTGVSVRTLHHYDAIGLLKASETTQAGYRLYGEEALERLQQIMLFKELEFSLREIKDILDNPNFNREKALDQQIRLLELRRARLDEIIDMARAMKQKGEQPMSFKAFDTEKIDAYAEQAKETWGETAAYKEYEQKAAGRTKEAERDMGDLMMDVFRRFGELRDAGNPPEGPEAIALAQELQNFITANYYTCTDEILLSLGTMYAAGGEFTTNIDAAGGPGTAQFAHDAIAAMVAGR